MWIDDMIAFDKEAQELLGELRERATASAKVAADPEPQPANNDGAEFCRFKDAQGFPCMGKVKEVASGMYSKYGVCTRCGR